MDCAVFTDICPPLAAMRLAPRAGRFISFWCPPLLLPPLSARGFPASEATHSAPWAERFSRNCPLVLSTPKVNFRHHWRYAFPWAVWVLLFLRPHLLSLLLIARGFSISEATQHAWPPWSSGFSCIRLLAALPPPVGSLLRLVRRHAWSSGPAGGFLRLPLCVVFCLDSFRHLGDELPMGGALHFPASAPFGIACLRCSAVLHHYDNTLGPSGLGDSFTFLPFCVASSI